jgi:hypothetical protein
MSNVNKNDPAEWEEERMSKAVKKVFEAADKGLQLTEPDASSEDARIVLNALVNDLIEQGILEKGNE